MTRLTGQHLALLLLEQGRSLVEGLPAAPQGPDLVERAFEAAIAQERQLAHRTSSAQARLSLFWELLSCKTGCMLCPAQRGLHSGSSFAIAGRNSKAAGRPNRLNKRESSSWVEGVMQ